MWRGDLTAELCWYLEWHQWVSRAGCRRGYSRCHGEYRWYVGEVQWRESERVMSLKPPPLLASMLHVVEEGKPSKVPKKRLNSSSCWCWSWKAFRVRKLKLEAQVVALERLDLLVRNNILLFASIFLLEFLLFFSPLIHYVSNTSFRILRRYRLGNYLLLCGSMAKWPCRNHR